MKSFWIAVCVGTALGSFATAGQAPIGPPCETVDFRYSPPWWQTAVCLPDDPDKILVGKEGQLLLDYGHGGVRNFAICVQPEVAGPLKWLRQQTASARAPIVETRKEAGGIEVLEETFVVTPGPAGPATASSQNPPRRAVVLVTLRNRGGAEAVRQPGLRVQSTAAVRRKAGDATGDAAVLAGPSTRIAASGPIESCRSQPDKSFLVQLAPVTLKAGESRQVAFTVDRNPAGPTTPLSVEQARAARDTARQWWEKADLPFAAIEVPDRGIQDMLQSCVRNIWQAREIRNSLPAFHVGPTCYRGLWVVDGSFLLEAAAIVGRGKDARAGIEHLLGHQKPDGSFEIMQQYWKENGIVLWAATRHALLTQDKQWLRQRWPALARVVKAIQSKRLEASKDPHALDYRLLPGGVIDGGIWNGGRAKPEFSNAYWCLTGLKAAVAAAHWLGDESKAQAWQKEYDDFYATFRKAADRDALKDAFGNRYVPVMMGNADHCSPQKGQWVFCHAVYPGQIFPAGDPLAQSQMAMLRATKVQGMVFDTGWMHDGIWTYFASFYGHAALWQGRGQEAAEVLYSYANHACPTRVWREEQKPVGKGHDEVGDMPHNWASAEFIRLTAHLVELDRGRELHLFEGLPQAWTGKGLVTRLNGVATPFGPLTLELKVAGEGGTARLRVEPLADPSCTKIIVHLVGWASRTRGAIKELSPAQRSEVDISLLP